MIEKAEKYFEKEYNNLISWKDKHPEFYNDDSIWYSIQRCYAVFQFVLELVNEPEEIDELDIIYQKYFKKFKEMY